MGKYRDEIERFIYEICYQPIWAAISEYVSQHLSLLDLTYSRVKYPDSAYVEDMLLEFTKNIRIDEDTLSFDAVVSCTMNLTEDNYRGTASCDLSQWFLVSCEAVIEDKLKALNITNVQQYTPGLRTQSDGQPVSKNIVPILYKKDLEAEASAFLEKYCPEALETPMPVPIAEIAKTMGLEVVEGHRITDDFSIFGEIYFSPGRAEVYDLFQCSMQEIDVRRGTILIDAYTYWERNLGCVKNTIAHEVYHWHKHRMYAAIRYILYGKDYVACRCPSNMVYPDKDKPDALADKIARGKAAQVMDLPIAELDGTDDYGPVPDLPGADMPHPSSYLSAKQRDGEPLGADIIFTETIRWLKERGCDRLVNPRLVESYSEAFARYIQCSEAVSKFGLLGKHPTTQAPIASPFVQMALSFQKQANLLWYEIFDIVKQNCTTAYEGSPQDDAMEKLLRARSKSR